MDGIGARSLCALGAVAALSLTAAGCGDDDEETGGGGAASRPRSPSS